VTLSPIIIKSKAGIKRDGTQFEGDYYVDGKWCRFQRGLPRKIGGYRRLTSLLAGPPRELESYTLDGLNYIHSGSGSKLERFTIDSAGNVSLISDRTPAGYVANANNDWTFASVFDTASGLQKIIAQPTPSLMDVETSTPTPIYIGDAYGTAALVAITPPTIGFQAGSVFGLQSYLIYLGCNGTVGWSVSNAPGDVVSAGAGAARVTNQKLLCGLPLRGGGNSPAALLWSVDSLIRMFFVGGGPVWQFDTLSSQISVMGPNTIIEYDGIYYWMGVDRFQMFNGVYQELDNDLNLNFLFDNFNYSVRGKAYAFKIPRFGEIWWCVPMFGSTEPNWAIIFNVRESRRLGYPVWYDTPLPDDGRGAAHYAQASRLPIMTSTTPVPGTNTYALWQHETGVDRVEGSSTLAIQSYFETGDISFTTNEKSPSNASLRVEFIEPDFVQSGDMICYVSGRANARSEQIYSAPKIFPPGPGPKEIQLVNFREVRRELRFKFESNVVGGDYQMGQCLAQISPDNSRVRT
jgi:hypothetical protein